MMKKKYNNYMNMKGKEKKKKKKKKIANKSK